LCYEELRLELHKAKSEMFSYEEILKLIQEKKSDEGSHSQTNLIKQNGSSNNEHSQL